MSQLLSVLVGMVCMSVRSHDACGSLIIRHWSLDYPTLDP